MTLSEFIIKYRKEHKLSQRALASKCSVSTGYISLIEKEINPQTGKKMIPTLVVLNKLAKAMGLSVDELITKCDNITVDISSSSDTPTAATHDKGTIKSQLLSEDEDALVKNYRKLNEVGQEIVCDYAEFLLGREKYKK